MPGIPVADQIVEMFDGKTVRPLCVMVLWPNQCLVNDWVFVGDGLDELNKTQFFMQYPIGSWMALKNGCMTRLRERPESLELTDEIKGYFTIKGYSETESKVIYTHGLLGAIAGVQEDVVPSHARVTLYVWAAADGVRGGPVDRGAEKAERATLKAEEHVTWRKKTDA